MLLMQPFLRKWAPRLHSPAAVQLGSNDGLVLILVSHRSKRVLYRSGVIPNVWLVNVD